MHGVFLKSSRIFVRSYAPSIRKVQGHVPASDAFPYVQVKILFQEDRIYIFLFTAFSAKSMNLTL